ncbi:MAG: T9SS type A sorting domain-containing protein, partial [Bacteroidetes bacterium]
ISSDTGKTWDSLGLPLTTISVLTEDSQGRIYASTNEGIYRYVDSTEWEFIGPSASQFDDFLITRSNVFIATASSQGLYRSSDYGRVWEKTTTINSEDVSAMYVDKQNAIYAGTMGNSIFSSSFIGTGWRQTPLGTTGSEITSFTGIDTFLFAGTDEGLYRTSNRGLTWTNITSSTFGGTAHSVAVNSGKEVFVGTNFGLYYSTDYGDSWQAAGLASQQVFHVAIDPSDKIAVSTGDSGIFVSQDNGASWDYAGLAGEDIISMAVNYAGEIFAGGYGGVSRSTDNGLSWIQRTFDNTYVLALATRGRQVFAGTYNGVFTSTNNGDTWSAMSKSGLKTYTVLSLTFDNLGNLVAGIYQGGVYRTLQSYTGVNERDELPGAFVLNQNYPNPFNPSTVIRYLLSVNGNVTLKVYDVLGREVATLVDEFQASGFKSQVFDASGLASGVYFYTLTVVGHDGIMSYTDVKKMLLIR